MYYYHNVYGYNVKSVINLYFLSSKSIENKKASIEIEEIFICKFNNKYKSDTINLKEIFLYRKNLCNFYITDQGSKIYFLRHDNSITDKDIAKSIINSAFGYCLYQMKHNVLHASAIEHDGKAVLFLGSSGSGKSSLAASLNKKLITEDVACIENKNHRFLIKNGPPFVKLDKKIANLLELKKFSKINNDRLGRNLYYINQSNRKYTEIKCIYFLSWGKSFSINDLSSKETIACFLTNSYSAFPYNSCTSSSKISMLFINEITKKYKIYLIQRNKDSFFDSNNEILDHIALNAI